MTPESAAPPRLRGSDQERLNERAVAEMDRLFRELEQLIERLYAGEDVWGEIKAFLPRFDYLQSDLRTAQRVLGMIAPFRLEVQDTPKGVELRVRDLGDLLPNDDGQLLTGDQWRFPQIESAVEWLRNNELVTADEFSRMQEVERVNAISAPSINDQSTLDRLRELLSESLREGDSLHTFRQKVRQFTDLMRRQEETLYRTKSKQAYLDGQEQTLNQPRVRQRFTHVLYVATEDNRTRPDHAALDGMVAERGTPLHELMKKRQREWNCRCAFIPLQTKAAERRGVNTLADVPAEFR